MPSDIGIVLAPCQLMLPPDDRLCSKPARYIFELRRDTYRDQNPAPERAQRPLIGYACDRHGKDARAMPGLVWIRGL